MYSTNSAGYLSALYTEKQFILVHGHSLQYVPIGLAVFEMLPETCTLRLGGIQ